MKRLAVAFLCLLLCLPTAGLGEGFLVSDDAAAQVKTTAGSPALKAAVTLLDEGRLLEAVNAFTSLGTAEDANLYAGYATALLQMKRQDLAAAQTLWEKLDGFLDSDYRLALTKSLHMHRFAQNGKFGFVDATGAWVIAPQYDWAERVFRAGSAPAHDRNTAAYGPEDLCIVALVYNGPTEVGRAGTNPLEGKYGLVRGDGTLAVPVEYTNVLWTAGGVAAVEDEENCYLYRLATASKIGGAYEEIGEYAEGYINVKQNGLWGYLNPVTGEWLGDGCVWESALPFSEGMAGVSLDGQYGFIDLKGKIVIDLQYTGAAPFGDGLAGVRISRRWGFINAANELVIKQKYKDVKSFQYGLCAVKKGDDWGVIDAEGAQVLRFKYAEIGDFDPVSQRCWFRQNKLSGLLASDGSMVLSPTWSFHDEFDGNTLCRVAYQGQYGFIDVSGKTRIANSYTDASPYRANYAAVADESGQITYLDKMGRGFTIDTNVPVECRCGFIEGRTVTETERTVPDADGNEQTVTERTVTYRLYDQAGQAIPVAAYGADAAQ